MAGREPMFALMRRQAIGISWAPLDYVPKSSDTTLTTGTLHSCYARLVVDRVYDGWINRTLTFPWV